jgi:hypothetical protein
MLTYLSEEWQNGAWVNTSRYTYTYDSKNNLASYLSEEWQNGAWVNYSRDKYTYDTTGKMLTDTWELWGDTSWVTYARNTDTYDTKGNLLKSLWELNDKGAWMNYNTLNYTYDINGNATHGEYLVWNNGAWAPAMTDITMYYNNGKSRLTIPQASVVDIQYTSSIAALTAEKSMVKQFSLSQNYPNPFNPTTTISYFLPRDTRVKLAIYDVLGTEVKVLENQDKTAGNYHVEFDASGMPTGVYFYRLEAGEFTAVKKLLLIK